jgi:hypothetical protein
MEPELPPVPAVQPLSSSEPAIPALDSPAASHPETPAYPDRSTGLTIFGIAQIILGLFAAMMIPLATLGMFLSRLGPGGAMRPRQMIGSLAIYVFISAGLITLGIGSIRARRWARALSLVTSWYWLVTGALLTVLLTAVLPVMMKSALAQAQQANPSAPPGFSTGITAVLLTFIIVLMAIFLVVVPLGFVIFYSRTDVAETCRRRDPVERWTDRAPLPVLGASVILLIGALYLLLVGVTTPLFPFFGRYLTGPSGTLAFIALAGLEIYLAISLFRLQLSGWWLAVCTLAIRLVSLTVTYARADLMLAYSRIGFSDAQLRMLNANPMFRSHTILWWGLFSMIVLFGYLIWIKRYFKPPIDPVTAALQAQLG